MARDYEILVRVNFGPPEHYQTVFMTEEGVKFVCKRLDAYGHQDRHYEYKEV